MSTETQAHHERVFDIILKEDELDWRDMIFDLVRTEGMDPWDIDVSQLSANFLKMLGKLKELDFRVSGKMVLASSLLLKIKSDNLLIDGIEGLDRLLNGPEEVQEDLLDDGGFEYEQYGLEEFLNDEKKIVPRTPQPRERKVSVFDLVDALEQALNQDIKRQRTLNTVEVQEEITAPKHVFDLTEKMVELQNTLSGFVEKKSDEKVFFHNLTPSDTKEDLVYTFLPLLHLENSRAVDLIQEEHFGDIEVQIHKEEISKPIEAIEESA